MANKYSWDFEIVIKGRLNPPTSHRYFRDVMKKLITALRLTVDNLDINTATMTMRRIVHGSQTFTDDIKQGDLP